MIMVTIVEVFRVGKQVSAVMYVASESAVKDLVHAYDLFRARNREQA